MALKRHADRKVAVGGLIVAAVFLALVAIIVISAQEGFLRKRYELRTLMEQVNGLQDGAPVWLAGHPIGNVSGIIFITDDSTGEVKLEVRMKINKKYQPLITSNSKVRIGTLGLLGDKYVAMTLGSPDSVMLQDRDYLQSTSPIDFEELISRSVGVIDDFTATTSSFKEIVAKVNEGTGTLGKFVNDPNLYFDFEKFFMSVEKLSSKVEKNEGTIGLLFNDPGLYHHLDSALIEIASLADTLKSGEGTLKQLLRDPKLYNNMVASVARIDSLIIQIQMGKGTTGQLISNAELYNRIVSSVSSLDSLVSEIKNNPGKFLKVKVSLF